MKQKLFLVLIFLAFCFLTNINAQVEKVSSTYNSLTGKWTYTARIPAEKSYTQPFVAGDWEFEGNDWKKQDVKSENGMYEFSFSSYNRIARFYYCDRNDKKAVAQKKGIFFDGKERCYHVGLSEGEILPESKVSFPLPGDYGDNILRYSLNGNIMTVYFNNTGLPQEGIFPFAASSCKGLTVDSQWPEEYQNIIGGSGWGWIQVDITKSSTNKDKKFIYFYYGGKDQQGNSYFPDIRKSDFINLEHDGLMIRISN